MAEMEDPNLNPDLIQDPSCKTPKHANNQIQTVSLTDEEGILTGSEFQFDVIGSPIAYGVSVKKNFQSEGLSVRFGGVIESPVECEVQVKNDSPQSDISVTYREGLSARSDEVIGSPIVCGISVRNDPDSAISDIYEEALSTGFEDMIGSPIVSGVSVKNNSQSGLGDASLLKDKWKNQMAGELENLQVSYLASSSCKHAAEGEHEKLRRDYELQQKELTEIKNALQGFKTEYALKSKECQDAWNSLRELQNELMRKSMHVGSLAYAIEGQIKEKSQWFSSLRDLTNKFKLLRIDHNKLLAEASEYKKCLPDVNQMFATVQSTMNEKANLDREHADLKVKFIQGAKERKELYNRVLELKGNIRVFCRCRPLNGEEIGAGASMAIDFESAKYGELTVMANGTPKKVFKFDSVFGPQADQADVFEETIPFATSVLDGYNVCIFAYGQTGTGKTFTMEGTEEVRGVNYRTLEDMFHIIKERKGICRYEVSVSALEVYNEQIRDLLVLDFQPGGTGKRLEIRQVGEGHHQVPGLVEAHVSNMSEVWEVLQTGSKARAVGATNANEHSSRSHCIHCVMVKGQNLINGECTKSKLWLVDLAGSERIAKTDVQGDRLKETQNINRSLSALGDVISALATKSPHIPFRNSKLTHLLQDSLGGDSKTLMFVQISPNENDLSETLCSLNFASRVRGVELGPAKKQIDINELAKCKQMVEKVKQDMKSKDDHIRRMEDTIHGLEMKLKTRDLSSKNLQEKVKELESQLLIERRLARQHVDTKITELQQQQKQRYGEQTTPVVPPVAAQPIGNHKNEENLVRRPLTENNKSCQPSVPHPTADSFPKFNTQVNMEKENKPENTQQLPLTRKAGRFSMCPTSRPFQEVPASRRNSLIPLPSTAPALHPLQPFQCEPIKDVIEECKGTIPNSEQTPCSRRGQGSGNKKISSILRRSLQKKVQIKSPMQQRRGGTEKVANPTSQRGRMGQKLLPNGNATKGPREVQQKQIHKEKEKGWNL